MLCLLMQGYDMPIKDNYHDTVITALRKDGWSRIKEQLPLTISTRTVWVDIKAQNTTNGEIIVVEIKGFENIRSPIDYFEDTVGQYMVYRIILEEKGLDYPLYLAVPHQAYSGFFREEIVKVVIEKLDIKLLVFDTNLEEIVLWRS